MTDSSDSNSLTGACPLGRSWFAELPLSFQYALQNIPDSNNYFVALSGGVDSSLLLVLASRYFSEFRQKHVTAIHVHHGISDYADQWQSHCETVCERLGVRLIVRRVSLGDAKKGVEEAARAARYSVFEEVLPRASVLLQGHHQNDQAETVLLRLMRGAGAKGIAGIPQVRPLNAAFISRPFLSIPRVSLLSMAEDLDLEWVEDDSNVNCDYDRNFVRHEIMPRLESRWKGAVSRLAMSADHCRESAELEESLAEIDLATIADERFGLALSIEALIKLSLSRQRNVVRYWLRHKGLGYPGEKRFQRIWTELLVARDDASPLIEWSLGAVRRYRNAIFSISAGELDAQKNALLETIKINADQQLSTKDSGCGSRLGMLFGQAMLGKFYSLRITHQDVKAGRGLLLRQPVNGEQVSIQFRRGGELFRPVGKAHNRPLKKWFHDCNVPPWLRDSIPLLYYNESLVAVGDLLVADGFQRVSDTEYLEIKWG